MDELKRCKHDVVYFIEHYFKVRLPKAMRISHEDARILGKMQLYNPYCSVGGVVPLILFPFQKEKVIPTILNSKFTVVDKPRQTGVTTMLSGIILHDAIFNPDSDTELVSKNHAAAKDFLKKIKIGYEYLPEWMKEFIDLKVDNVMEWELVTGSKVRATASTDSAGRGGTTTRLILDECAWGNLKEKAEDVFAAAEPALQNTGGSCIAASTPAGIGNWYHRTVMGAMKNENGWAYIPINWYDMPGRDYLWLSSKLKRLGRRVCAQEYLRDFLGAGNTVLPTEAIEFYQTTIKPPIRTESGDRVKIWADPDPQKMYFMGSDVGTGSGADNSTFVILEVENREIVATFQGKLGTRAFSKLLKEYATRYGNCIIAWEVTGVGEAVREDFMSGDPEYSYNNLYYHIERHERAKLPGWKTTPASRPLLVSALETHIGEARDVHIYDERIVAEMTTFVWGDKGKPDHETGYHDDLLFALMLCIKCLECTPMIDKRLLADPKLMRAHMDSLKEEIQKKRSEAARTMMLSMSGQQNQSEARRVEDNHTGKWIPKMV